MIKNEVHLKEGINDENVRTAKLKIFIKKKEKEGLHFAASAPTYARKGVLQEITMYFAEKEPE